MLGRVLTRFLPHSTRGIVVFVLLIAFLPMLLLQLYTFYDRYGDRRAQESLADLEIARAVASAFDVYLRDVLRHEFVLGKAIDLSQPMSAEQVSKFLAGNVEQIPAVGRLIWLTPEGRAIASSDPNAVGTDYQDRSYFQQIARGDEWAVSELLRARVDGKPGFAIARGIRGDEGSLQGVLVAGVDPELLDERELRMQLTGKAAFSIFDGQGRLVYRSPNVDLSWEQRSEGGAEAIVRRALAGEELTATYTSTVDGQTMMGAFTPIRSISWVVGSARSEAEVMAPMNEDLLRDVVLALLVGLAAFFAALLVSRWLTYPLSLLRKHSVALGSGNLDERVVATGPLEFKDLALAFNVMADDIQAKQEALKVQNEDLQAANEALIQAQEDLMRLAAIVQSSEDAIIGKTLDGIIVSWNGGAERLYGYAPEEIIGKPVAVLVPSQVADDLPAIMERIRRGEGVAPYETVRVRKDGSPVDVSVTMSPVKDLNGNVIGASTIARDITQRNRAEQEIMRLNADLERRAAELTAVNKDLEAFSYSVAHDLRAPLRSIDGFSQALLEDCADQLSAEGKQHLQRVRAGSQQMAQLIDGLLGLSRMSRGEMHFEEVDLSALAQSIAAELFTEQPGRRVEFICTSGVVTNGDARLLRIVIENLLRNAWKFTGKHSCARIEFGVAELEDVLAYFVRDDGAGFDMSYADKLFGAFQRLHGAADFPGTGIGLATVQRIIRRHGGNIWAEGAVEQGATFYFTL
ncbi:MAG: PAS domain S-box protein [Actinobacteria bacterium]|nr:PAS domain S-box protein [Actinomycetota bacterium]